MSREIYFSLLCTDYGWYPTMAEVVGDASPTGTPNRCKALSYLHDRRTLSSNILKIIQHEGANLFDSAPVASRAREA
jgi:hypothetical protein